MAVAAVGARHGDAVAVVARVVGAVVHLFAVAACGKDICRF